MPYTPDDLAKLTPIILAIGNDTIRAHQADWQRAHNGREPEGSAFVRRWALKLRSAGIEAGVNGKRGSQTLSQDVLTFPVTEGGALDTSGRYPRIVIADVIGGAGGPNPSLVFNDVSPASPGRFILPTLDADEAGGAEVAPPSQVIPPAPVPPPVAVAPPDFTPILQAIAYATAKLAVLEGKLAAQGADAHALTDLTASRIVANRLELETRLDAISTQISKIKVRLW